MECPDSAAAGLDISTSFAISFSLPVSCQAFFFVEMACVVSAIALRSLIPCEAAFVVQSCTLSLWPVRELFKVLCHKASHSTFGAVWFLFYVPSSAGEKKTQSRAERDKNAKNSKYASKPGKNRSILTNETPPRICAILPSGLGKN